MAKWRGTSLPPNCLRGARVSRCKYVLRRSGARLAPDAAAVSAQRNLHDARLAQRLSLGSHHAQRLATGIDNHLERRAMAMTAMLEPS